MKKGANYSDIRRIKALDAEGMSAEEISEIVRIVPECVANFMPSNQEEKPKRKRRTKEEIAADKAAEEAAEE